MDQETLFTSSKWDILTVLSTGRKSPLELARETKTSIANISQQLRMLELANIVKSERVSNRERGEPRLLYSLAASNSYLISIAPNFVNKRQLLQSIYHEIIMRIWFLKDESAHYYVQKYFWEIEPNLDKIDSIAVKADYSGISVIFVSSDNNLKKELKSKEIKKSKSESRKIDVSVFSKDQLIDFAKKQGDSFKQDYIFIYDPQLIIGKVAGEDKR